MPQAHVGWTKLSDHSLHLGEYIISERLLNNNGFLYIKVRDILLIECTHTKCVLNNMFFSAVDKY